MTFIEAIHQMTRNKKVLRSGWAGYYLAIIDSQNYIWAIGNDGNKPVVNVTVYVPSVDDIMATDWMIKTT